MDYILYCAPVVAVLGLVYALIKASFIKKQPVGNARMDELSTYISEGAMAFLKREYRSMAIFVVAVFVILGLAIDWLTAICFIVGAIFSVLAGLIGMKVATKANVRTANAANTDGMSKALSVAFSGGTVMGMCVVGLGLLGTTVFYLIFKDHADVFNIITGFGFGASSIALFARVGGGIYTKAADVGADLVGKVEAGIPEDDPRN